MARLVVRDEALARSLAESPGAPEASRDDAALAQQLADEALARELADQFAAEEAAAASSPAPASAPRARKKNTIRLF